MKPLQSYDLPPTLLLRQEDGRQAIGGLFLCPFESQAASLPITAPVSILLLSYSAFVTVRRRTVTPRTGTFIRKAIAPSPPRSRAGHDGVYYDYIIVGGGTAGCPLATTISRNFSILLLERGGFPFSNVNVSFLSNFHLTLAEVAKGSASQFFSSTDGVLKTRARILGGGCKRKVTSLVAKEDFLLATWIEEALQKNESLEAISKDSVQRDVARTKLIGQTGNNARTAMASRVSSKQKDNDKVYSVIKTIKVSKVSNQKDKGKAALVKPRNSSKVKVSKRKSTGTSVRKTTNLGQVPESSCGV